MFNFSMIPADLVKPLLRASLMSNFADFRSACLDIIDWISGVLDEAGRTSAKPKQGMAIAEIVSLQGFVRRLLADLCRFEKEETEWLDLAAALLSINLDLISIRHKADVKFRVSELGAQMGLFCVITGQLLGDSGEHVLNVVLQAEWLSGIPPGPAALFYERILKTLKSLESPNIFVFLKAVLTARKVGDAFQARKEEYDQAIRALAPPSELADWLTTAGFSPPPGPPSAVLDFLLDGRRFNGQQYQVLLQNLSYEEENSGSATNLSPSATATESSAEEITFEQLESQSNEPSFVTEPVVLLSKTVVTDEGKPRKAESVKETARAQAASGVGKRRPERTGSTSPKKPRRSLTAPFPLRRSARLSIKARTKP